MSVAGRRAAVDGKRLTLDQVTQGTGQEEYRVRNILRFQESIPGHALVLTTGEHLFGPRQPACGISRHQTGADDIEVPYMDPA